MNDLAGAYALDAVSSEEAALVEAHLKVCEACCREVEELREVVDVLPLALEPVEPAPDLKSRLLTAARADTGTWGTAPVRRQTSAAGKLQGSKVMPLASLRRIPRLQAGLVAAALAAVLALAIWNVNLQNKVHDQQTNLNALNSVTRAVASGARVSDFRAPTHTRSRAVFVQPQNGSQAFVVAEGLPPPAGKVYQLWLIDSSGPVSAGVFPLGGSVQVWHVSQPTRGFSTAAVTLEPGPSGSRRPTTSPILITHLAG